MKDNVILEVKNVEKFFYGNKKLFQKDRPVVKAVNDVSFTINEGETFGIVGESDVENPLWEERSSAF